MFFLLDYRAVWEAWWVGVDSTGPQHRAKKNSGVVENFFLSFLPQEAEYFFAFLGGSQIPLGPKGEGGFGLDPPACWEGVL